jgi:hypothetical protein
MCEAEENFLPSLCRSRCTASCLPRLTVRHRPDSASTQLPSDLCAKSSSLKCHYCWQLTPGPSKLLQCRGRHIEAEVVRQSATESADQRLTFQMALPMMVPRSGGTSIIPSIRIIAPGVRLVSPGRVYLYLSRSGSRKRTSTRKMRERQVD